MVSTTRLPVTVVTGFLGAGKTTVLRQLLRQSGQRLAVLVNEFGEVGIDGQLLKSCQVIGVFYGSFSARYPKENSNNFDEILNLHKAGEINPLIGAEFRLEEFSEALNCLAKRTATGKIIVNIN